MEGEILGITSGGGSSADVRYVTFMNEDGTVELGKKAVATGDDCADPIDRGVFSTPTKESTAQYTYTFYGWATTPNGTPSKTVKVTGDTTLYAIWENYNYPTYTAPAAGDAKNTVSMIQLWGVGRSTSPAATFAAWAVKPENHAGVMVLNHTELTASPSHKPWSRHG